MSNSVDFIWDQTNINIKSRKFKLNQLIKHNYEIHAIAFDIQKDIIFDRLKTRENQTGKSIPESVIFSMINSYQPPSLEEGFQSVTIVDPFGITLSTGKKQSSLKI
jgi:predicted kinase